MEHVPRSIRTPALEDEGPTKDLIKYLFPDSPPSSFLGTCVNWSVPEFTYHMNEFVLDSLRRQFPSDNENEIHLTDKYGEPVLFKVSDLENMRKSHEIVVETLNLPKKQYLYLNCLLFTFIRSRSIEFQDYYCKTYALAVAQNKNPSFKPMYDTVKHFKEENEKFGEIFDFIKNFRKKGGKARSRRRRRRTHKRTKRRYHR